MEQNTEPKTLTRFLKITIRALFSHLGLLFLVVIFTISGGFIFQLLEKHAYIQKCEEGEGKHRAIVKKLSTTIFDYVWLNTTYIDYFNSKSEIDLRSIEIRNKFYKNYNQDVHDMLIDYRKNIIEIYSTYKYRGQNCINDTSWILESSLLFTLTLLTTIGYGHITPITWEGMVVCVCFSMIGIPLCLLCVSKMSRDLADIFRTVFSSVIKFFFGRWLNKKKKVKSFKPKLNLEKLDLNEISSNEKDFVKNSIESENEEEQSESEDSFDEYVEERITVPLIVIMIIIVLYVTAGSYIFQYLEGWSGVTSSYFSFITMATIGFGDVVPGIKYLEKGEHKEKVSRNLLIAAVYLFVGISILAMCFELLQETFIIKMVKFTNRLKNESASEIKKIELRINKIRPFLMNKSVSNVNVSQGPTYKQRSSRESAF